MSSSGSRVVEEARQAQAEEIGKFVLESWHEAGPDALGWTGAIEDSISVISAKAFWESILADPNRRLFICKNEDRLVGFAVTRKISNEDVELAGIIVIQDSLGHGFGSMLLSKAKEYAMDSHYGRMLVKTERNNERAISFYKSKGFIAHSKDIEEIEGTKVELLVLSLKLESVLEISNHQA